MCCYHSRGSKAGGRGPGTGARSPSSVFRLPSFRDDRGVATLEGILLFAMLAGVLLGVMLLGQWGTHRQYAQMGARLLTFDAGDESLATFGRPGGDAATESTFSSGTWDTYAESLPADWLNTMFVDLPNPSRSASVTGTQQGRLPSQGTSLFGFSPASLGYHSASSAASDPWADTTADVRSTFLGIAYWVGYNASTPEGLGSIPTIPHSGLPLLESIYTRVGVR